MYHTLYFDGDKSIDNVVCIKLLPGDQCLTWKLQRDVAAMVGYNFKLSNVRKLVIVTSVNQEDLIHHKLRRCPHPLADVEWKISIRLQHVSNHLVDVVCGLLILEQLNHLKESQVEGIHIR